MSAVEPKMNSVSVARTTPASHEVERHELIYLNNPDRIAPVRVDITAPTSVRNRQITRAVHLVRPDLFGRPSHTYASVQKAHRITIRQLGGGLSNHLFVAYPAGERTEPVLVRVHAEDEGSEEKQRNAHDDDSSTEARYEGAASEASTSKPILAAGLGGETEEPTGLVDREVEHRILAWLSSEGLAPTFHGRFENGRVEEFYDGYRPLSWDELSLPMFAVPVAQAMANLHNAVPPDGLLAISDEQRVYGEIWSRINEWFELARNACGDDTGEKGDCKSGALNEMIESMLNEWSWLCHVLKLRNASFSSAANDNSAATVNDSTNDITSKASSFFRQVLFTHMDCQSLNILTPCSGFHIDDDSSDSSDSRKAISLPTTDLLAENSGNKSDYVRRGVSIRLIDFEYAGLNARAVDIANTFCEHTNMNNLEPNYDDQYPTDEQQNEFLRAYTDRASPALADRLDQLDHGWTLFLETARDEVGKHTLLSHMGWAIWAIAQAKLSNIEFDYCQYAKIRMDGYYYFKQRYWEGRY